MAQDLVAHRAQQQRAEASDAARSDDQPIFRLTVSLAQLDAVVTDKDGRHVTTRGPDGWATVRENPERIRQVTREVEGMGLKVIAQYALMGQYDFLNVIESPDEATMARAAIMLAARGTMRTTTLQAISVEELIESLKSDA